MLEMLHTSKDVTALLYSNSEYIEASLLLLSSGDIGYQLYHIYYYIYPCTGVTCPSFSDTLGTSVKSLVINE